MAAKLALFATSTIFKPDSEFVDGFAVVLSLEDDDDDDVENETLIDELLLVSAFLCCDESWRPAEVEAEVADEIVSSKELNLVRFIIQPSILRSSLSSVTFCHETLSVVDETASTMTSSGWPGKLPTPTATPANLFDCRHESG